MYISQNTVFIPLISLFLFDHYSAKILLLQDKTIQEINNFVCAFMRGTERRDNKNDKTQRQYQ